MNLIAASFLCSLHHTLCILNLNLDVHTGHSGEFMQDGDNVLVELDMLFKAEDWQRIQEAFVYSSSV